MIKTGTKVSKKSGKPFQNGKKVTTVQAFTFMMIPCSYITHKEDRGEKIVPAVLLDGCKGKVRLSILEEAKENVHE